MGTPKALLTQDGETFADRLIRMFRTHCREVVVVLGHDAERIRAGIRENAIFVINPDPDQGQLSSLQCGLKAVPADCEGVFFMPVDYPSLRAETLATVATSFTGAEACVVPTFGERHGHPVLIAARLIPEFLSLPAEATARDVIHSHRPETRFCPTNDSGILHDVDSPEDLRRVRGENE
jgi:CTP:molybdopterin cytidylyltransferase MocA